MKQLLLECKDEIRRLRRENEILSAKVSTMELFATVLHTAPRYPDQPMCEDVAWKIDKEIAQLDAVETREKPPAGFNHFCPGESGQGEWSHLSTEVPCVCGYCGVSNEVFIGSFKQ